MMSSPRASEGTAKSLEKLYASILSRISVFTKANSGYININCIGLNRSTGSFIGGVGFERAQKLTYFINCFIAQ